MLTIYIDKKPLKCKEGDTILEAADSVGIYIPRLCHHPDLPYAGETFYSKLIFQGNSAINSEKIDIKAGDDAYCNLCLVNINDNEEPVRSCTTIVEDGMIVHTNKPNLISHRKQALSKILAHHPHACLTCAQKEGCSRTQCSANVPIDERCCVLLGSCELEKVSDYIGIPAETPKYVPRNLPVMADDPLFNRDFNLCISCLRCVRICRDVRRVDALGAAWNDNQLCVGTVKGAGLKEADCRFCGACVEACPTGAFYYPGALF
jgi:formate dehydrogenase beta subunit